MIFTQTDDNHIWYFRKSRIRSAWRGQIKILQTSHLGLVTMRLQAVCLFRESQGVSLLGMYNVLIYVHNTTNFPTQGKSVTNLF
jgi:hypothetical protein